MRGKLQPLYLLPKWYPAYITNHLYHHSHHHHMLSTAVQKEYDYKKRKYKVPCTMGVLEKLRKLRMACSGGAPVKVSSCAHCGGGFRQVAEPLRACHGERPQLCKLQPAQSITSEQISMV
jgi:hypothetical protein